MTSRGQVPPAAPDRIFPIRTVDLPDDRTTAREILSIGCDPAALRWLLPKSRILALRVAGVPSFAANLLKQEILSFGGDAVVHRGACTLTVERTDVLLLANPEQLKRLVEKLRVQVPTLRSLGRSLEAFLRERPARENRRFVAGGRSYPTGRRTYLVGILNVTPDSFSDGGRYDGPEAALRHALEMERDGADFIDVGGESTRPGHGPVDAQEEMDRVLPVLRLLRRETGIPVSIDTWKSQVARVAVAAGAVVINDVWGLRRDPDIAKVAAETGAGLILMHNRGTEAGAAPSPDADRKGDILDGVVAYLRGSMDQALAAGVPEEAVVLDPGIGFGVRPEESLRMIEGLGSLRALGRPVLIGPSRKSFIGKVLDLPVDRRLLGTAASIAYGIARGADFVRVHDVAEMREVVRIADALRASGDMEEEDGG